jgi:hypothetical protein
VVADGGEQAGVVDPGGQPLRGGQVGRQRLLDEQRDPAVDCGGTQT